MDRDLDVGCLLELLEAVKSALGPVAVGIGSHIHPCLQIIEHEAGDDQTAMKEARAENP